jgi:voltage-gated potassium channel
MNIIFVLWGSAEMQLLFCPIILKMIQKQFQKVNELIRRRRYSLLLLATVLVLVLPAFSGTGLLSEILFMVTMSFLFIQSTIAANIRKSRKRRIQYIVIALIMATWLKPIGIESVYVDIIKILSYVTFFIFVMIYLFRFIIASEKVNFNVLITSVNIYLLGGIIGAFIAFLFNRIYPDAYNFPEYMGKPEIVNFVYYTFITMSTVGYGDITPRIPETQTLAYFLSVSGQLYVAIIIAFLVGKLLVGAEKK